MVWMTQYGINCPSLFNKNIHVVLAIMVTIWYSVGYGMERRQRGRREYMMVFSCVCIDAIKNEKPETANE